MQTYGTDTTQMFWHYAGSIFVYTAVVIGLIYAAFYYLKKNPNLIRKYQAPPTPQQPRGLPPRPPASLFSAQNTPAPNTSANPLWKNVLPLFGLTPQANPLQNDGNPLHCNQESFPTLALSVESTLPLENGTTLLTLRVGCERFLVASDATGVTLLATLQSTGPAQVAEETMAQPESHNNTPTSAPIASNDLEAQMTLRFRQMGESIYGPPGTLPFRQPA